MAATMVQKTWRRYCSYNNFKQLRFLMKQATTIQGRYRLWQLKNQTQKKLKKLRADQLEAWRDMQKSFKELWPTMKREKRIEIHINSFSLSQMQRMSIEKFKQKENCQISRLFAIKDPNVEIIYICPFPLTNEIYDYYLKILELVEIENPELRLKIIVPENYVKFSKDLCLTQ